MLSDKFLELGVSGLGRCVDAPWDAHFPAAVLAGYYYAAGNQLSPETERAMSVQLEQLIAAKPDVFVRYVPGGSISDPTGPLHDALAVSVDKFSELGHNSIFAAYALRAIRDLNGSVQDRVVRDIVSVIRQFDLTPARYWLHLDMSEGHDPRKFALAERSIFTDNTPDVDVARAILDELPKFKNVYTQMGSKSHIGHLLTQAHSLLTLRRLGFPELANRGLYSLECRFVLLKDSQDYTSSPRSFYRPATRSALLPDDPAYWAQDFTKCEWDEGHTFKYTLSFHELMNLLPADELNAAATEKFRYLISPNERSTSR